MKVAAQDEEKVHADPTEPLAIVGQHQPEVPGVLVDHKYHSHRSQQV